MAKSERGRKRKWRADYCRELEAGEVLLERCVVCPVRCITNRHCVAGLDYAVEKDKPDFFPCEQICAR